jgi:hypothetical protein
MSAGVGALGTAVVLGGPDVLLVTEPLPMNTPTLKLPIDLAQRILEAARIAAALHAEQGRPATQPHHQPAGGADGAAVGSASN